jgi:hypothetical protein
MTFRHMEAFEKVVLANDSEIMVRSSGVMPSERAAIERNSCAVISHFGAMSLALAPEAAIEFGNALIQAGHHYRSHANARFDEFKNAAAGEAA